MLEKLSSNMQALLKNVKERFDDAVSVDRNWQDTARESFEFRDNKQWSKEEEDQLDDENRPHLTFNITKAHIDLIMGLNEDQRKRYVCTPVNDEDAFLCEVLNTVIYWLYEQKDWEDEEDVSFHSSVICGRGWTSIDFDIDPNKHNQISIDENNVPIHEIRRDPSSRKTDLSDASYLIWDKWLSCEDFIIKYPKLKNKVQEAFATGSWPENEVIEGLSFDSSSLVHNDLNDTSDYSDSLDIGYYDTRKRQLRVAHMEYWKNVDRYWVRDPKSKQWSMVENDWATFKKEYVKMFPGTKMIFEKRITKEVWWIQFSGDEVLYHGKSPMAYPGFSVVPCFLYSDVSRRSSIHYGIVELMKDAQREVNKRWSQTLNLLNQQVQPGIFAEIKAFVNQDQAEQSIKEAGSITWLQDGALAQKRFQERTVPSFPTATMQMEEFAQNIVKRIIGINPDLMGQNDKRQEAGIVVQLRQQQSMTILKPVFKAYDKMRQELFKRQVSIVTQHMPMSQIAKIMGQSERYEFDPAGNITDKKTELTCNVKQFRNLEYDVDGEPTQASLTQNMMELATYTEMMKNGFPVDPLVIISKTNLPATEKLGWIEYVKNQQQSEGQSSAQQFDLEKQKLDQLHEREMAKIDLERMVADSKITNQREKDFLKASTDQAKLDYTQERDQANLKVKMLELMAKVKQGNTDSAFDMLELLINNKGEQQKQAVQLFSAMIKSKTDLTVQNKKGLADIIGKLVGAGKDLKVATMKANDQVTKEKGKTKNESNKTNKKSGKQPS